MDERKRKGKPEAVSAAWGDKYITLFVQRFELCRVQIGIQDYNVGEAGIR
jgi:hypothetical protein